MFQIITLFIKCDYFQLIIILLHYGFHTLHHSIKNRRIGHDGIMGTIAYRVNATSFIFL